MLLQAEKIKNLLALAAGAPHTAAGPTHRRTDTCGAGPSLLAHANEHGGSEGRAGPAGRSSTSAGLAFPHAVSRFSFSFFCLPPSPPPPLCLDQLIIWSPLKRRPPPAPPRDHGENGQARGGAHRRGWINGFQLRRGGGRAPLS
jgi:hypothetical protein